MEDGEASNVLDSMIQFINNHGEEQADQLRREADQEFTIECEKLVGSEREKLKKIFEQRLEQEGVEMKIKKSAQLNKQRIRQMVERNKWVEEAFKVSKVKLNERLNGDADEYKELLKNLIVQGLVKLMESKVRVMCRQSDEDLVRDVLDDATAEYKRLMAENVVALKGNEPPCEIEIDPKKYLPEYNPDNPTNSCSGGVKLHARKGRIVCSNTIDDRLELVYQEATPEIRKLLLPNY